MARKILHPAGVIAASLLLTACGGGGGGNGGDPVAVVPPPAPSILPSALFRGSLVVPGGGANAGDWSAESCTDPRQKNWVRSWLFEDYLFYREAPLEGIDPDTYTGSVASLFGDYTVRGVPARDRFSFVIPQAQADATFRSGTATSIGISLRRDFAYGGIIRIAHVDPNGPGTAAGFRRGMVLASIDGVPTSQNLPQALSDRLFASPAGTQSVVGVQDVVGGPVRTLVVATASFNTTPLIVERILPGTSVGYLVFNSFSTPIGEVQLADAIGRFAAAGVTDVVLDLRYNGGGFLDIAAQLGYMLAGADRAEGRVFEQLVFNDKRSTDNFPIAFRSRITGFPGNGARAGEPLPSLNLQRVFVLATGSTCSASESVINGLQGVDVPVVMIGGTTCGKPYGFSQDNNCTLSYFGIEFEGRNQKGAITPLAGVVPDCPASDDFDRQLGDPGERLLATALSYGVSGACPPPGALAAKAALPRTPGADNPDLEFMRTPQETVKLRATGR